MGFNGNNDDEFIIILLAVDSSSSSDSKFGSCLGRFELVFSFDSVESVRLLVCSTAFLLSVSIF